MNSFWLSLSQNIENNHQIDTNYLADVCIIGAGITGLSTAYYLAKKGLKVIVVDKSGIGQKASGHTTAKITSGHNLIYDYLINSYGTDFALKYFESNQKAISNIKNIIDSENIDCDFEYQNNYIYTTDANELPKIHNEIKALNILGGENFAKFVTNTNLPFKIAGAIETQNQAQFHPIKYMLGLANAIKNYGGLIFTNSLSDSSCFAKF
jgi:glycine/D-amino acid oxidase-like deaminating enzyme